MAQDFASKFPELQTGSSPVRAIQHAPNSRAWIGWAIGQINEPKFGPVDPPLVRVPLPELPDVQIFLKDETAHPTRSLKHRLAHALFLHALCSGRLHQGSTVVEASSGSTAISEAWFAQRLGLRFIAVVPASIAASKVEAIRSLDGEVVFARDGRDVCELAASVAQETGGHFMDQFTNAAEVTDWRGANNIADTLFAQLRETSHPIPRWIVVGAGTGGTSSTIGRYIRLRSELAATGLCVVDPEGSAFFQAYASGDWSAVGRSSPIVEGIGRARVEPGFNATLVDQMIAIPDAGSVAGARWLEARTGRCFGPSTGTNIVGALMLAQGMALRTLAGSIVTLGCDDGERYRSTIYCDDWLREAAVDVALWARLLKQLGSESFPFAEELPDYRIH